MDFNKLKNFPIFFLTAGVIFLFFQNKKLSSEIAKLNTTNVEQTSATSEKEDKEDDHKIELAVYMGRMQLYASKLYFAGRNKNRPLAEFYHHELMEVAEEIEHANVVDDEIEVSSLLKNMLMPALHKSRVSIESTNMDEFEPAFKQLIETCNACHVSSKHPFIKIKVPEDSEMFFQDFSK